MRDVMTYRVRRHLLVLLGHVLQTLKLALSIMAIHVELTTARTSDRACLYSKSVDFDELIEHHLRFTTNRAC